MFFCLNGIKFVGWTGINPIKNPTMKKLIFPYLLVVSLAINAQTIKKVEKGLFKVNVLAPGIAYELGIGSTATINLEAVLGFALHGGSDRDTEFGIYPGIQAEYRNYVNMNRRIGRNKNISGNSANYLSFLNQFQLGSPLVGHLEYSSDYFYNIAAVYGIQRMRPKGFYWSIAFGPALYMDDSSTNPGIFLDGRLGWVLDQKKK